MRARRRNELAVAFERTHDAIRHKAWRLGIELSGGGSGADLEQQTPAVLRRVLEPTCQATLRRASSSAADP